MEKNLTGGRGFEQIDAAEKRGFAGAGSTDNADDISVVGFKINVFQHLMVAEAFAQMAYLQDWGFYFVHVLLPP